MGFSWKSQEQQQLSPNQRAIMADHETEEAKRLILARRASVQSKSSEQSFGRLRTRSRTFSNSQKPFTYQEINQVLDEVVDANGPVGVIKALLALGADVNFSKRRSVDTWSKLTGRKNEGWRSDILIRATVRCPSETVYAIAHQADQENLDGALHHAMLRGNLAVLQALLDHGANPVQLHDDFLELISRNQVDLVQAILAGHRLPCLTCRSSGLRIAAKNGSLEIVSLLLKCWADVNHDGGAALVAAVEARRPDLVAVLISGPVQPSPRSLDAALGRAHKAMVARSTEEDREIIEMCLSAGAAGEETTRLVTEGVVAAVRTRHIQLLDTVLRVKRPPPQYEAMAMVDAVKAEHIDVLSKLLVLKPQPRSLMLAVSQAVEIHNRQTRHDIAQILIDSGAQGPCTAEALVKVVKIIITEPGMPNKTSSDRAMDKKLFRLLLQQGKADVNYGNGEALQIAVQKPCPEIAEEIVGREPSPEALGAALPWAMDLVNPRARESMIGLLLRKQINEDAVGKALVQAFKEGPDNGPLIKLLLTRASVNHNNGEVFIFAIRQYRPETFRMLLDQGISYKALFTAINEALKTSRTSRRAVFADLIGRLQFDHLNTALKHVILEADTDLPLAKSLLEAGAEATHENGVCIKNAASNLDRDTLGLLTEYSGTHDSIFTQSMAGVVNRGKQWIAFEHVEVMELLVRGGASTQVINKAVVEVIDTLACKQSQIDLANRFLDIFFAAGADVNCENGKPVGIAASRGDPVLLARLLSNGASSMTSTHALSTAIMAHHEENLLLRLIDVFADRRTAAPDVNQSIPGMPSPIFLCLKSYPKSLDLLDSLVGAGCDLESTVLSDVCPEEESTEKKVRAGSFDEPVTVLLWTLLLRNSQIDPAVVNGLVRHGANIAYATPRTHTTALMLAVKSGRFEAVQTLLDAGAKVHAKDSQGRSALYIAARLGNADIVAALLRINPSMNDGSLHEASRNLHVDAMRLLVECGHDPNYRSSKHDGRTAFGEMALKATVPRDITIAEEAVEILCTGGASPLLKTNDKTILFLALDNMDNEAMTRLLLDKHLYRILNTPENMYVEDIYHYSPTMYVKKGMLQGPRTAGLIEILEGHGGEDRYYATMEQKQPHDAVGMPEEIQQFERERRARERRIREQEEEHAAALRREFEKAKTVDVIEDLHHDRSYRHYENISDQHRRNKYLDHQTEITIKTEAALVDNSLKLQGANVDGTIQWQHHNNHMVMGVNAAHVQRDIRIQRHAVDMNIGREAAHLNRSIAIQHHNDGMVMASQQRGTALAHMRHEHRQVMQQRKDHGMLNRVHAENRHAFEMHAGAQRHRQALNHQRSAHQLGVRNRAEHYNQGLEFQGRAQQMHERHIEAIHQKHMMLAGAKHTMNMTELGAQRGNIIGQTNLNELRQWSAAGGRGGGGSVGYGGGRVQLLN
ncbi:hypothetical protein SMAC4_03174 [Sordaria macrospora]|uniref:uncharacterized protein n=1 Tax=Sordaria macrospora TaxID=5147 RepID=UPI002B2A0AC1|nr:hypothetical protein SMAC4_03174 [Sordaria macrospora]